MMSLRLSGEQSLVIWIRGNQVEIDWHRFLRKHDSGELHEISSHYEI